MQCGMAAYKGNCHTCGSEIGGESHILTETNTEMSMKDTTQTGHCLSPPDQRAGEVPAYKRTLSPVACCIMSALMHCALLWGSCNNVVSHGLPGIYLR